MMNLKDCHKWHRKGSCVKFLLLVTPNTQRWDLKRDPPPAYLSSSHSSEGLWLWGAAAFLPTTPTCTAPPHHAMRENQSTLLGATGGCATPAQPCKGDPKAAGSRGCSLWCFATLGPQVPPGATCCTDADRPSQPPRAVAWAQPHFWSRNRLVFPSFCGSWLPPMRDRSQRVSRMSGCLSVGCVTLGATLSCNANNYISYICGSGQLSSDLSLLSPSLAPATTPILASCCLSLPASWALADLIQLSITANGAHASIS